MPRRKASAEKDIANKDIANKDIMGIVRELAIPGLDERVLVLATLVTRLGRLNEMLMTEIQSELFHSARQGTGEPWVLTTLLLQGPPHRASPTHLSRISLLTSGGMTKALLGLEADGLIRRVADPADGRGKLVELTRAGLTFARANVKEVVRRYGELFGRELASDRTLYRSLRTLLSRLELLQERGDSSAWLRL